MPLVAFDTNIIDEFARVISTTPEIADAMEALEEPPGVLDPTMSAMYWIVGLRRFWSSCLCAFSDRLYAEVNGISDARAAYRAKLLGLAIEIREGHPQDCVTPDARRRPSFSDLHEVGLKSADAEHIANAIGLGASDFLTLDRGILGKAAQIRGTWGLRVATPGQFLMSAVRGGAPWPSNVPWPWEAGPLASEVASERTPRRGF